MNKLGRGNHRTGKVDFSSLDRFLRLSALGEKCSHVHKFRSVQVSPPPYWGELFQGPLQVTVIVDTEELYLLPVRVQSILFKYSGCLHVTISLHAYKMFLLFIGHYKLACL